MITKKQNLGDGGIDPSSVPWDETFDVGVDTRTGVEDKDYQVPFLFNGTLSQLTLKLGPVQLTSADDAAVRHASAGAPPD